MNAIDTIIQSHGGPFEPRGADPQIQRRMEWIKEDWDARLLVAVDPLAKANYVGRVHLRIIDNFDVNAFAVDLGAESLVGLYAGADVFAWDVFNALLAHPAVFPEIGKASGASIDLTSYFQRNFDGKCGWLVPDDRHRCELAEVLFRNWTFYVVGHEIGHILKGHLWYLNRRSGLTEYLEYPLAHISAEEASERRLLEIDADKHGVSASLIGWGNTALTGGYPPVPPEHHLRWWAFSLSAIFRVLDLRMGQAVLANSTHPTWDVRCAAAYVSLCEIAEERTKHSLDYIGTEFFEGQRMLERVWRDVNLPRPRDWDFQRLIEHTWRTLIEPLRELKDRHLKQCEDDRGDYIRSLITGQKL